MINSNYYILDQFKYLPTKVQASSITCARIRFAMRGADEDVAAARQRVRRA